MSQREAIRDETGEVVLAVCVTEPLTDEERAALLELAKFVRAKQEREDPDNLRADKQRRAIDRVHRRVTPTCSHPACERVDQHDGRHTPELSAQGGETAVTHG